MPFSAKQDDSQLATVIVTVRTDDAGDKDYAFKVPFKVGRVEECEICIRNDFVSRSHASVSIENGEWWLSDLNSSNGLYVGDERVPRVQLKEGLTVRLGIRGPELRFRLQKPVVISRPT